MGAQVASLERLGRGAARARRRGLVPAALLVAALASSPGGAAGQEGATVASIVPERLELLETAGVVEVRVTNAPASSGYQFELGWDPAVVAVTAVAPGDFLARGGETLFTPRFTGPGSMVVGEVLPDAPAADALPSGDGALAYVTLAPLAADTASALGLTDANLVGLGGEGIPIGVTVAGEAAVVGAPPAAQATAAVAQATALATELGSASPRLPVEIADLGEMELPEASSTAIWLGLLGLALAIVGIGWFVGRGGTAGGDR
jgi:hypothetical protein